MTGFVLNMTGFVLNMTGFVLNTTGFVLNMTGFVINMTGLVLNMIGFVLNMTESVINITSGTSGNFFNSNFTSLWLIVEICRSSPRQSDKIGSLERHILKILLFHLQ